MLAFFRYCFMGQEYYITEDGEEEHLLWEHKDTEAQSMQDEGCFALTGLEMKIKIPECYGVEIVTEWKIATFTSKSSCLPGIIEK